MAILNVSATRMVLLELGKRVKTAQRGHKLLKDKQDGLMQKFMAIIREVRELRRDVEKELAKAFEHQLFASALQFPKFTESALSFPQAKVSLAVKTKNVMSVHIPEFTFEMEGKVMTYGIAQTSAELDTALRSFSKIFPKLIRLAGIEKAAEALAAEIETTRRRVNALEHKIVPDLKETVKFIKMKLDESARGALVTTMAVKKMISDE
jgi:V/A-type H+-transporting ATPase subunit D